MQMISTLSPAQSELPDALLIAQRPSSRRRPPRSEFSEQLPFANKPSLRRRASRALARYAVAVGVGVAGTLAWQSYGGVAMQTLVSWAAQHGWSPAWLAAEANPPSVPDSAAAPPSLRADHATAPSMLQAESGTQTAPVEMAASTVPSADPPQLTAITASLAVVRQAVEQLVAGQERIASDIAKLQTVEQDIRHRISAAAPRPAAPPASKPSSTPRAPAQLR
jgi:hypothetical protein